jgi:hypothetical protein
MAKTGGQIASVLDILIGLSRWPGQRSAPGNLAISQRRWPSTSLTLTPSGSLPGFALDGRFPLPTRSGQARARRHLKTVPAQFLRSPAPAPDSVQLIRRQLFTIVRVSRLCRSIFGSWSSFGLVFDAIELLRANHNVRGARERQTPGWLLVGSRAKGRAKDGMPSCQASLLLRIPHLSCCAIPVKPAAYANKPSVLGVLAPGLHRTSLLFATFDRLAGNSEATTNEPMPVSLNG